MTIGNTTAAPAMKSNEAYNMLMSLKAIAQTSPVAGNDASTITKAHNGFIFRSPAICPS